MTFIQPKPNAGSSSKSDSGSAESGPTSNHSQRSGKPNREIPAKGKTRHLNASIGEGTYIVFDIETTGGNPEKNGITEIFALRYHKGQIIDTFYSMVNPGVSIPPIVRRMTGITNKMVRDAPPIKAIMPEFIRFIADDILVAHNTIGDMKFIRYFAQHECQHEVTNYFMCTHLLVEKMAPNAPDKSLRGLGDFFKLPTDAQLHRAEADTYLTLELFKVLLQKLEDKGIKSIADAIRFQGDFESGTRLGWGVKPEALAHLPDTGGVFYLYDFSGHVTFLSSAHSIAREVKRLQKLNALPKQLLRAVLSSSDIRIEETPTAFAAALLEAQSLVRHRIRFDPANWHQRTANFIYISKDEDAYRLTTGPLVADVVSFLGPIRGGKDITTLLDHIARILGRKPAKKGLQILPDEWPILDAFFRRKKLVPPLKEKFLSFLPRFEEKYRYLQKIRDQLNEIAIPEDLHGASICSGIVAVAVEEDRWHLYCVAVGRLQSEFSVQGDLIQGLKKNDLNIRVFRQLKDAVREISAVKQPLTYGDAILLNRMFWWAFFGERHENVRVIPMDTLARL
jgi:DNA polymerase III epsilon subunit family exonuclease